MGDLELSENQVKALKEAVQRLNDNNSMSKRFLENLSDEALCETALYQNHWVIAQKNENILDMFKVVLDFDIN